MRTFFISMAALLAVGCGKADKVADYKYAAVPFTDVHFTDDFLSPRIKTVMDVTIPFAFEKSEQTGRIANFAKAAGLAEGKFEGLRFNDSDVFKIMEGAAYALAVDYDPALDKYMDSLIMLVAGAQEPDGYLYTVRTINNPLHKAAGAERWSYIRQSHELYNVGHMYEAAVAHFYATGKRTFLDVAVKNADLLYDTFYVPQRKIVPGHQEVELGLAKLYRATGDRRYLDLAQFFLDCRGEGGSDATYWQDHLPVTQQTEAVGHAVRAVYQYIGMADVAALGGNPDYISAIDRLWENVAGKKLYITGGIGSVIKGESFGPDYHLPNDSAYCETCAGIANCMWNLRMFQLHGDAKYIDVLERSLYNNVLGGISLDGMEFFYPNILELREEMFSDWSAARSPWFDCSCCPSNLARFIPSLPGYVYATSAGHLYVNLFAGGNAAIKMPDGGGVSLSQRGDYPWSGDIQITLDENTAGRFALMIRIPGWASGNPVPSDLYAYAKQENSPIIIGINGATVDYKTENGYARLEKRWKKGDVISVSLPMAVHSVYANQKVEADRGKFSVERGPIVYCAEEVDNPGREVTRMSSDPAAVYTTEKTELFDRPLILKNNAEGITLIPYYARAHRGLSEMSVFLNRIDK